MALFLRAIVKTDVFISFPKNMLEVTAYLALLMLLYVLYVYLIIEVANLLQVAKKCHYVAHEANTAA